VLSTTRSNQRPDTLMQDRSRQLEKVLLQRTAGPYIWVIHVISGATWDVRFTPESRVAARERPNGHRRVGGVYLIKVSKRAGCTPS